MLRLLLLGFFPPQQEFIELLLHARHCARNTKMNKIVLVPSKLPGYLGLGGRGGKTVYYFYIHNALHSGWLVVETEIVD